MVVHHNIRVELNHENNTVGFEVQERPPLQTLQAGQACTPDTMFRMHTPVCANGPCGFKVTHDHRIASEEIKRPSNHSLANQSAGLSILIMSCMSDHTQFLHQRQEVVLHLHEIQKSSRDCGRPLFDPGVHAPSTHVKELHGVQDLGKGDQEKWSLCPNFDLPKGGQGTKKTNIPNPKQVGTPVSVVIHCNESAHLWLPRQLLQKRGTVDTMKVSTSFQWHHFDKSLLLQHFVTNLVKLRESTILTRLCAPPFWAPPFWAPPFWAPP